MPICKKCNKSFPQRIVIDGKQRHLINRKYCLECSPFGRHNTLKLHKQEKSLKGQSCKCVLCGKEYKYFKQSGHTTTKCNSCVTYAKRIKLKERMVEYKGGKCIHCGYEYSIQALEFHHRDPATKKFMLSGAYCKKWPTLKEELDKCDLVCSNCHREIEAELRTARLSWK